MEKTWKRGVCRQPREFSASTAKLWVLQLSYWSVMLKGNVYLAASTAPAPGAQKHSTADFLSSAGNTKPACAAALL